MHRAITRMFGCALSLFVAGAATGQTTITQWNFNSSPADASNSTGSTASSIGAGSLSAIGGTTTLFASGSAGTGSSDPATTDNTGLGVTAFPAQSTGSGTAGLQFSASTAGYGNIQLKFDTRPSNTSSRHYKIQYTLNVNAGSPVWVDFAVDSFAAGDAWSNNRTYNLSTVSGLSNNANAGFRMVAAFRPGTSDYVAATTGSNWANTGNWRMDMLTISGAPLVQSNLVQWNFNSVPADASNSTGSSTPSTGAGTFAAVGGTTTLFASGTAGTGSSDPAATDNTGLGVTNSPAQGTGNKTGGWQIAASTAGNSGLKLSFDARPSNTSTRHYVIQYTTDITAGSPTWVDFVADSFAAGDAWINGRMYDFSGVTALENNANAGFRMVAAYRPGTSTYVAATNGSNWAATGNWRMDMVTVSGFSSGSDVTAPVAQAYVTQSSTTSYVVFSENVTSATATNTANYSFSPALAVTNATKSGDTVYLTHNAIVNGQPYVLTVSNVQDLAGNTMNNNNFDVVYNASTPNLVITEIIHSPNDVESIEVYNAGSTSVNLGGLKWTDGTTGNFPNVTLTAGATVVFATSTATASTALGVSPIYLINNGLGSSDDILVIRNSLNQVVDSVQYFVGTNGWPSAATGVYAYSFELNSATNDNNQGSNWAIPVNTVTPQPSVGVIRSTMGTYPAPPPSGGGSGTVSFVGTKVNVNETTTTVSVIARLQNGASSASSIDLEIIPLGTATTGADFTAAASMQYNWVANANNVNDTLTFTINNDGLEEDAEYFIVRMKNPVNITQPAESGNNFTVFILDDDKQAPVASEAITLSHIGSFSNGAAGSNSAEIVAFDSASKRLFIANSIGGKLDVVNFSNPQAPSLIASISMAPYGAINSITARNGIVAAAIENSVPENNGKVVFFDINGGYVNQVTAGAMPDMITFNHAGTKLFTANEGQPNTAYTADPVGSVTIVDISGGVANLTQASVITAGFASFNSQATTLKANGVRIFGPGASVAQDMEPEYVAISADDQTAYVTCQENNAIAVIDIATATVTEIRPLGLKDHFAAGNALDANDQGGVIQIANWPIKGVYMPDAISSYKVGSTTYLVTANEGDAREYDGYSEIVRLSDASYKLDTVVFPYAAAIKANLGRLNITTASGDANGDGYYEEIHAYGGRSISIWNASTGALVWDSGDDFEVITSKHPQLAAIFNASNANNTLKNRSDDKGPEPEGVTTATINGKVYAFVALERIGGCMVYDVTDPNAPVFVDYKNTRTINTYGGDQGAEGIIYISASQSPNGKAIVILANEVSSTLSFYQVEQTCVDATITSSNGNFVCAGNPLTLTASTGDSYLWSNGNTTSSISASAAGTYSVVVTSAGGACIDTATFVVSTIPSVSVATTATSICDGSSVVLSLNNTANYSGLALQWLNSSIAISGATDTTYTTTIAGAYSLTVSNGACSRTSSVKNITVKPTPVAAISSTGNTVVCDGGTVILNADVQPNYTYRWLRDGVLVASSGTTYNAKVAGNYQVVAVLNGCRDTSSTGISVGITPAPVVTLTNTGADTFCSGSTATLLANVTNGSGNYQYAFTKGANVLQAGATNDYMATVGGSYRVTVLDLNSGCDKQSNAVTLKSYNVPYAKAIVDNGGNTNLSLGPVALRANNSPNLGYQWTLDGNPIPGANAITYNPTAPGTYNVVTSSGNGFCTTVSNTVFVMSPVRMSGVTEGFSVSAYPNPVANELTVSVAGLNEVDGTLHVLDMSGRIVATQSVKTAAVTINMANMANGMYLLQFNDKSGSSATLKVTKQ